MRYCICQILRDSVLKLSEFESEQQAYSEYDKAFEQPSLFAHDEYTSLAVIQIADHIAAFDGWSLLYLEQTILLVGRNRRLQPANRINEHLLVATYFENVVSTRTWEA